MSIRDETTGTMIFFQEGIRQYIPTRVTLPTIVAIAGASAKTGALEPGVYELSCSTRLAFAVGGSSVAAVLATGHRLEPGERILVFIDKTNNYIAGIQDAAAGELAIAYIATTI